MTFSGEELDLMMEAFRATDAINDPVGEKIVLRYLSQGRPSKKEDQSNLRWDSEMSKPVTFHKTESSATPRVLFADVFVKGQNGLDLVVHHGFAVSPPNQKGTGEKTFYKHFHQTDNNRCVMGRRVFELVATKGQMQYQHYVILLDDNIGALEILPEVYHRSVSCEEGSILLNHAVRDEEYESEGVQPDSSL